MPAASWRPAPRLLSRRGFTGNARPDVEKNPRIRGHHQSCSARRLLIDFCINNAIMGRVVGRGGCTDAPRGIVGRTGTPAASRRGSRRGWIFSERSGSADWLQRQFGDALARCLEALGPAGPAAQADTGAPSATDAPAEGAAHPASLAGATGAWLPDGYLDDVTGGGSHPKQVRR